MALVKEVIGLIISNQALVRCRFILILKRRRSALRGRQLEPDGKIPEFKYAACRLSTISPDSGQPL